MAMDKEREFARCETWDYRASPATIEIIDLPKRSFAMLSGQGDPNGPEFAAALGALYGFCYAVRMSYRWPVPPTGAYEYTVGVLQGLWGVVPGSPGFMGHNYADLTWQIMIRQPDFVGPDNFRHFCQLAQTKASKKGEIALELFDKLELINGFAGRYAQMLHLGPYATEPATFACLEAQLAEQGHKRLGLMHREIYLGDPRKTEPAKLKTILRVAVV